MKNRKAELFGQDHVLSPSDLDCMVDNSGNEIPSGSSGLFELFTHKFVFAFAIGTFITIVAVTWLCDNTPVVEWFGGLRRSLGL